MQSQIGSRLQAVELVVLRFREVLFPALDDYVAGGARVIAPAGMLQMHTAVEGDIEHGFRLAVIFVGQLSGFEFHRHIGGQKCYFRHTSSIASRRGLIRFGFPKQVLPVIRWIAFLQPFGKKRVGIGLGSGLAECSFT